MKNNLLTTILTWVLATSLILSMVFCIQFFFKTRELRLHQGEMARYQSTRQFVNLLVNDTVEYAKRDQGVAPILEVIGIKMTKVPPAAAGTAPATTKPAAK